MANVRKMRLRLSVLLLELNHVLNRQLAFLDLLHRSNRYKLCVLRLLKEGIRCFESDPDRAAACYFDDAGRSAADR